MKRDIVVIGASTGGFEALVQLASTLPADFPASILVALHVVGHAGTLPSLLTSHGANRALHPADGDPLLPGIIYVAPPDHHMLLRGESLQLTQGPKEHHTRPAVDPLFRSAALGFGARVIGVVLTGRLDDGTAGLQAIKACGGMAIVQDPSKAREPHMPFSALKNVAVDHCVPIESLGAMLTRLVDETVDDWRPQAPQRLIDEHYVSLGRGDPMEILNSIGTPSVFACPDCHSVLWEINDTYPVRYRCHTGHAFSFSSLEYAQSLATEAAIWSAIRAVQERQVLLRKSMQSHRAVGDEAQAEADELQAERLANHSLHLRRIIAEQ